MPCSRGILLNGQDSQVTETSSDNFYILLIYYTLHKNTKTLLAVIKNMNIITDVIHVIVAKKSLTALAGFVCGGICYLFNLWLWCVIIGKVVSAGHPS